MSEKGYAGSSRTIIGGNKSTECLNRRRRFNMFSDGRLILLRHKFCAHRVGLVMRVQHGHRDNRRMMAAATILRSVAMEFGM
jgi:hypothetical protein